MKKAVPRCKKGFKKYCVDMYDEMSCGAIYTFCVNELMIPFDATG
jgi:hypothetical protein